MGRYKELQKKLSTNDITDEEKAELAELEKDFADSDSKAKAQADDEEKQIEEASEKLAQSFLKKLQPLSNLADSLKEQETKVQSTGSSKMILDPQLGEVAVDKLDEVKVLLTDRKHAGKQNYEVTKKTLHFLQALAVGDKQKLQLLSDGTAANGGYLVPEDFVNIIVEDRRDSTVMRGLATVLPVTTDTIHIPNLATRPKAFWRSEAATKSTTTVTFGETVLTPYSLAAIVGLSNELVADAQLGGPIVSIVAKYMAQALSEEEDKAFWEGNGSGKPTGIDNYSFTGITSAITDSGRADAIIQSLFRLDQGYRNVAGFVANKNTWAKVATLKDSNNNYLLTRLGDDSTPRLRGRPIYEQNDIPDGRMFVGDFSYYYIADRQGITVDVSTEATVASQSAFERNLTFVRVEERVDGELTLTDPVVEINGLGGL